MAELDVQPKKKKSLIPLLLLLLGGIVLVWFLSRDKDDGRAEANTVATDSPASAVAVTPVANGVADTTANTRSSTISNEGDTIDFNAPVVKYDEIMDQNISVRGNNDYSIYSIGELVLFDEGKAELRANAKNNLNQVKASIDKRYQGGEIHVYGYTDAQGRTDTNKELAQRRAKAVKDWLVRNGIKGKRISVHAFGEARPAATNSTEQGRQQNRRVEIVARATGTT